MNITDISKEFNKFFEFSNPADTRYVTSVSCKLFADYLLTDQREYILKLEDRLAKSEDYIKQMYSVIDGKGLIKSCINPLVDLTNSVNYMVDRISQLENIVSKLDGQLGSRNLNKESEYLTLLTEMNIKNKELENKLADID